MKKFVWTDFYSEFATSLLKYAPDRTKLIEMIKEIYTNAKMKLPTLERDNNIVDNLGAVPVKPEETAESTSESVEGSTSEA